MEDSFLLGEAVPKIDDFLRVIIGGVRHERVVEFLGHFLLIGEQLLATKDIIGNHRKLAFF